MSETSENRDLGENVDVKQQFLLKYPFLAETNPNRFIGCYGGKFILQLALPAFPLTVKGTISVFDHLQPVEIPRNQKLNDVFQCMNLIIKFLDEQHQTTVTATASNVDTHLKILNQLERMKSDHSCKIFSNPTMSKIKLTGFRSSNNHYLEMIRAAGTDFQVVSHSLPDLGSSVDLFKWHASPEVHVSTFAQILDQLEEFYSNLNTLDELCHVVEPAEIDTRTTWRIIKFSRKVFLKITLHPLQPSSIVVAFIGPSKEIEYLRELYNSKMEDWDTETDVYTNLLRIFEIMTFPMRIEEAGEDNEAVACGICMSHRDENSKIPIVSCDNEKCSLIFHIGCVKQWFLSLKESRTFFAISVGTCPYCKQKLSSSFDELLNSLD